MQSTSSSPNNQYTRLPRGAHFLRKIASRFDQIFGKLYEWRFNPFASSGTVVTALLAILIVTGLYLILFYRLSAPYDSVVSLQSQVWLGRWIRSVHRYATDLGLIFILFHLFRMWAHGKTWGPRLLAWLSGLVMLGMYALSSFTGFILVWDRFGLKMAKSWAMLVDVLPILPNPLSRAFSGDVALGSSFFFMNLFLHIAIPLGLGAALWVHTSKLADPKWLPKSKVVGAIFFSLVLLSVLIPAKLDSTADLLEIKGSMIEDYWFSWWMDLQTRIGSPGLLLFFVILSTLGLLAPLYWRPKKDLAPPVSEHDEIKCEGCAQCYTDCPYEAISMAPRTKGTGSELVAIVNALDCTSCGICAGSCSQFAIGPPGRSGREQLQSIKQIKEEHEKLPVIYCSNRAGKINLSKEQEANHLLMPVDCLGHIHSGVVTSLLGTHKNVMLAPCEPDCCEMRMGNQIEWERLYLNREPALPGRIDSSRIIWQQSKPGSGIKSWILTTVATTAALFLVAWASNLTRGSVGDTSFLRLSWRFPLQRLEKCRDLSETELKSRPIHMRVKQECEVKVIQYLVQVKIDGTEQYTKTVISPGMKSDRPLLMDTEIPVPHGLHQVEVSFSPDLKGLTDIPEGKFPQLEVKFDSEFILGNAKLVTLAADQKSLIMR